MPVESYPWRFSSVISVGSHEEPDPLTFYYNPDPPVEFFARGVDVEVAWSGGAHDPLHRQQLRDAAHVRPLRAHPRQASGADAVPAEERALPDLDERGRWTMSDELRAAVAAGVVGSEESFRALAAVGRRGGPRDLRREGVLDLPARRGDGRARLRGRRGRRRGDARRAALPVEHGRRRLGARHPPVARDRGREPGSALLEGRRREHGLRAEGPDGGAAAPRRAGAGRARGARPARSGASSRSSRWICSGSSRTRRRSRSTSFGERGRPRRFSPRAGRAADVVARLAATVDGLEDEQREAGLKLLGALEEVLKRNEGGY